MKYLRILMLLALVIGSSSTSCSPEAAGEIRDAGEALLTQYRLDIELVHSNSSEESEFLGIGGTEDEIYFLVQQLDLKGTTNINSSTYKLHPPTNPDIIKMGGSDPLDTNKRVRTTLLWDDFEDGRLTEIILIVAEQDNSQQSLIEQVGLGVVTGGAGLLVDELIGDGLSEEEIRELKELSENEIRDGAEAIINALRADKHQDLGVVVITIGNPKDDDKIKVELKTDAMVSSSTRKITEETAKDSQSAVFALSGFESRYDLTVSLVLTPTLESLSGDDIPSDISKNYIYVDQSVQHCSRDTVRVVDRDGNDILIEKGMTEGIPMSSNEVTWYCESIEEQDQEGPLELADGVNYIYISRESTGSAMTIRGYYEYQRLHKSPTE